MTKGTGNAGKTYRRRSSKKQTCNQSRRRMSDCTIAHPFSQGQARSKLLVAGHQISGSESRNKPVLAAEEKIRQKI